MEIPEKLRKTIAECVEHQIGRHTEFGEPVPHELLIAAYLFGIPRGYYSVLVKCSRCEKSVIILPEDVEKLEGNVFSGWRSGDGALICKDCRSV